VTGPTGVGKSSFALELARRLDGEIVCADAFQIYDGLPVLTAQPTPAQRAAVPHHLYGFLDLRENFDAARYARAARDCLADIQSRGKLPILVGGTGLYLKALTHGLAEMPPADPALRARVSAMPLSEVLDALREADPDAPALIDICNPVRVRRALEIVLQTSRPLAESRRNWNRPSHEFRGLVLNRPREELHARIRANVESMLSGGAIEEVRRAAHAGPGARRAIGFSDIENLLAGLVTESACRESILAATRQYAKRQLTWCRTQFDFPVLDPPDPDAALRLLQDDSRSA
jgi:tRNA dimethylallyltransferase